MALLDDADVLLFLPDEDPAQVTKTVIGICARIRLEIPALKDEAGLDDDQRFAVNDILRKVAIRELESDSGTTTTTDAAPGGYQRSVTVLARPRKGQFYETEIDELRKIVEGVVETPAPKAFSFGTGNRHLHDEICSSLFGPYPCDCSVRFPPAEVTPIDVPW